MSRLASPLRGSPHEGTDAGCVAAPRITFQVVLRRCALPATALRIFAIEAAQRDRLHAGVEAIARLDWKALRACKRLLDCFFSGIWMRLFSLVSGVRPKIYHFGCL